MAECASQRKAKNLLKCFLIEHFDKLMILIMYNLPKMSKAGKCLNTNISIRKMFRQMIRLDRRLDCTGVYTGQRFRLRRGLDWTEV